MKKLTKIRLSIIENDLYSAGHNLMSGNRHVRKALGSISDALTIIKKEGSTADFREVIKEVKASLADMVRFEEDKLEHRKQQQKHNEA